MVDSDNQIADKVVLEHKKADNSTNRKWDKVQQNEYKKPSGIPMIGTE